MSIQTSRKALEDALTAASIRVMPQGSANPPSVFVFPNSAWIEPNALGLMKRAVNWVLMCVVSVGSEVSISDAETLAESIDAACRTLAAPWGLPTISAPGLVMIGGLQYVAFRAEIRTLI